MCYATARANKPNGPVHRVLRELEALSVDKYLWKLAEVVGDQDIDVRDAAELIAMLIRPPLGRSV